MRPLGSGSTAWHCNHASKAGRAKLPDVEALKAGLAKLLNRPDMMKEYGRLARERAEIRYGWEAITDRTVELYEETIRLRNGKRYGIGHRQHIA